MTDSTVESGKKSGSSPKGRPTPKAKDHQSAQQAEYRRARLQWIIIGTLIAIAIIATIVLLSVYTDGDVGGHG